jgi:hypothetical protein
MDLNRLMGADGKRGLPRVIVDAITYLRTLGPSLNLFPSHFAVLTTGLSVEGLFRISPAQSSLQTCIAAYDRGHPLDLADYGPHVTASLIKQFMSMLPMPIFPAHIYPALTKFPSLPESERTSYILTTILPKIDGCAVVLLAAVMGLLAGNHRVF